MHIFVLFLVSGLKSQSKVNSYADFVTYNTFFPEVHNANALLQPFLNQRKEKNDCMNYFIISTQVWGWAGIKLTIPESAIGLASNCATVTKIFRDMRLPAMWYVRPAKAQTKLRIAA